MIDQSKLVNSLLWFINQLEALTMNIKQVNWAKQHDWFLSSYMNSNGSYTVRVYEGENETATNISHFQTLCDWAGY